MVKCVEYPEPGEHADSRHILGEGPQSAVEGIPKRTRPTGLRRWQHTFAPEHLNAPKRRLHNGDVRHRTSDDLYAIRLSEENNATEPRNDTSAAHSAPETLSDAVPDDAPMND